MDSLYGGKPGVSFVLKGRFSSVADMIASFKQGSAYKDVWYNEYCLIDTPNKNDKDNGKLYRRGMDSQNANGGAIYLGQIVGASSGTPYTQLDSVASVQKKGQEALPANSTRKFPTGKDSEGNYIVLEGAGTPAVFDLEDKVNHGIIPGKYVDNGITKYNDTIKYTWVNIRKDNTTSDSWFYVGMSFPYTVIDYAVHQVSQYDEAGNLKQDATNIKRVDDLTHPYYEKWDFGIPKGIKGDTLRKMRVIVPTALDTIYAPEALTVNKQTGKVTFGNAGYDGMQDDIANSRKIIVFDYYSYDDIINPEPKMIYLGDFNIIDDVEIAEDGTLTIGYTHESDSVFTNKVKWIKQVTLTTGNGNQGGRFTVKYNNHDDDAVFDLTWIKDIQIDKTDGTITYTYAGTNGGTLPANGVVTDPKRVKWVKDVALNTETGHFEFNFNDSTKYEKTLDWVKDITINEQTGDITVNHTTGEVASSAKLKIITSAETSVDGTVSFRFNTGEVLTVKNLGKETAYKLKTIESVQLASDITQDKHIRVKYNTETQSTPIGDSINHIQDMCVRPSDFHLLVLFSAPDHRPITNQGVVTYPTGTNASNWINNNVVRGFNPSVPDYGSTVYWRDYGTVKDQHGILIGFNVTQSDVTASGKSTILDYLNFKYPNGLTGEANIPGGENTKHKIITFSPNGGEKSAKEFYAFDYNKEKWFFLGTIADTGSREVMLLNKDEVSQESTKLLSPKGMLFKYEQTEVAENAMPKFWSLNYTLWT